MIKRIYIWGSGYLANEALSGAEENLKNLYDNDVFHIEGIIDNNKEKYHTYFHGIEVVSPGEAINKGFDYIIIIMENEWDVEIQAKFGYRIEEIKIKNKYFFLQLLLDLKYRNSIDEDIQSTLAFWKKNDISMFNNFLPKVEHKHQVIWDKKNNLPYIEFEDILGKKRNMYFPRNFCFEREDGIQVVSDILWEQQDGSPHLYTYGGHNIEDGDVIADGGVCEGNFALRYIDVASKIYLFEPDYWWEEAHYYTFGAYMNKVRYYHKGISNRNEKNSITLDSIFSNEKLDFLKMDIEGAELNALYGAEKTFRNNNLKTSICCYHKKEDEKIITEILKKYGYKTSTSDGVVVFLWDNDIWRSLDFRKGVIYGSK